MVDDRGMTREMDDPQSGVLAACGVGLADVAAMREPAGEAPLAAGLLPELGSVAGRLTAGALSQLAQQGVDPDAARTVRRAHLRYEGTDTALPVPLGPLPEMVTAFERAYRQYFSFLMRDKAIVAEAVSVRGASAPPPPAAPPVGARAAASRAG